MTWDLPGTPYPLERLGDLEPFEVLYDYDGPRIFTTRSPEGGLLLAYQCGEDENTSRFLLVPASDSLVDLLRKGQLTVREVLMQPWAWLVDRAHEGHLLAASRVDGSMLPEGALPRPGVFLYRSLQPLLSVRMVGEGLGRGNVPASVIRRAVEGASHALKVLVEWVMEVRPASGRPEGRLRRYYDLPAQRFAFASFEVSFAHPPPPPQRTLIEEENQAIEEVGSLLSRGMEWATASTDDTLPDGGNEWRAILEALSKLTPPRHGVVTEVHLGGRLVGVPRERQVLTRRSSERVQRVRERILRDIRPVRLEGYIRELDKDKLTFILRDPSGTDIRKCSFSEPLYDDVLTVFDSEGQVAIQGHESISRTGVVEVASIDRLPPL